jgi:crotonobetainyl-CoA:carnitine CoA-transferase CaiB-like acyl-CoA transferase
MGADVIKVEPRAGAPARRVPPFAATSDGSHVSLHFLHYNTNKRSVVLDLDDETDVSRFCELSGRADVILDALVGGIAGFGISHVGLMTANPQLIYARLTPFGQDGPWSALASSDLVQLALGGTMAMTGYDDRPDGGSLPIAPAGGQAAHMTGLVATIGVLGALNARLHLGRGQIVDVAAHDVVSTSNEMGIPYWIFKRANVYRHTGRHAHYQPVTDRQMFRCRDGKYAMCLTKYMTDDKRFEAMRDWFDSRGLAEFLTDAKYLDQEYRKTHNQEIIGVIERFCGQTDSDEVFHQAQTRKLPWAPVNQARELLDDPHLVADRQAIVTVHQDDLGPMSYPGAPYKFSATPWWLGRTAPVLGDDREIPA